MINGIVQYPHMSMDTLRDLNALRGPFQNVGDYLASSPRAELLKATRYPERTLILSETEDEDVISSGVRVMRKGIDLCYIYPGDTPIQGPLTSPGKPYTIRLEDFRLVNMLVRVVSVSVTQA